MYLLLKYSLSYQAQNPEAESKQHAWSAAHRRSDAAAAHQAQSRGEARKRWQAAETSADALPPS